MFDWLSKKKNSLIDFFIRLLNKKKFIALFHVQILGGFLTLFFGLLIALKRAYMKIEIKEGIAAQILIPSIFTLIASVKYLAWFLGFDLINDLLFYVLIIYLLFGYGIMFFAALNIFTGKKYSYFIFYPLIKKIQSALFDWDLFFWKIKTRRN